MARRVIFIVMLKDGSEQTVPGTELLREDSRIIIKNGDHLVTAYDVAEVVGWREDFEHSVYGG